MLGLHERPLSMHHLQKHTNQDIDLNVDCLVKIRVQNVRNTRNSNVELNVHYLAKHLSNSGSEVWKHS